MKNESLAMLVTQPDFLWPRNTTVLCVQQIHDESNIGYMLMGLTTIHIGLVTLFNVMEVERPNEYNDMLSLALAYACGRLFNEKENA